MRARQGTKRPPETHAKLDIVALREALTTVGVRTGQTLCVHASWKGLRRFSATPAEVIALLLDMVGLSGTLVMPAFPSERDEATGFFDVRNTPTAAGLLAETFRRWPGVRRSININHSVCAIGPNTDFLIRDHHHCTTVWDETSPYYRLTEIDGKVLEIGLGHPMGGAAVLHCADSILRTQILFFEKRFPTSVTYIFVDEHGQRGTHTYLQRHGWTDTRLILPHIDHSLFSTVDIPGCFINLMTARDVVDGIIGLARRGITYYVEPQSPGDLFIALPRKGT